MAGWERQWDNRKQVKRLRLPTVNERTWTRRVRWYCVTEDVVKLKFEDGDAYAEYMVPLAFAQTVWDRFKEGQTAQEAVSILGREPLPDERSKRMSGQQ